MFLNPPASWSNSYPPLQINRNDLQCVTEFRYLGVILTQSLSWSRHISSICSKSRKILGLIFRHFYKHSSPETIIRQYTTLVRPLLEYCFPVWSPSSSSQTIKLESVQSLAIKLAYKFRPPPPQPLNLHSLSSRRTYSCLKILFTISHNLSFFPHSLFKPYPHPTYPIRSYHPKNFAPPTCHTPSFSMSFPSAVQHWNSLPAKVKEPYSLPTFVQRISPLIMNSYCHHT